MDVQQDRLVAGRYRLRAPLGSGGMGTVWRAEDEVLGRAVAVKEVVFPHGLSDEDRDILRERTRREARAAARLDHPSAVTVFDVVEEDGSPFLVMELVDARTLSQVVRADGPLSPERTAHVGLCVLGALQAAHRQGIVHRDVKPGNVLLGSDDRVVLTDFGIASSVGDASITSTGLLLGSPSYIAPERARGEAPGPASDLWSLGATLFTAVEGKPPFDAGEPLLTVTAVVTGEHAPFVRAGPLALVLEGLLERDPSRRLDVEGARRALEAVIAAGPPAAPVPDSTVAMPLPATSLPAKPGPERTAAIDVDEVREVADGTSVPTPVADSAQRPPRRRSRAPFVLSALVLLVAAGIAALLLTTEPGTGPLGALDPRGDGAEAGASDPAGPAALPEGWVRYADPAGWSVGTPPGYVQSTYRGSQVQLRDPQTRRTLRIDVRQGAEGGALAVLQELAPQLEAALAQYEQLRLEAVDADGFDAAELEFRYFDQTTLHVVDRALVTEDGTRSTLYWQVPDGGWADSLPVFEQIAATFRAG